MDCSRSLDVLTVEELVSMLSQYCALAVVNH